MVNKAIMLLLVVALLPFAASAKTTGKITGVVKDKQTGEPLPGVNISLIGTTSGASTDLQGTYAILNIPAGTYAIKATLIGYRQMTVKNVRVVPDFTTAQDFDLSGESIQLEAVEVTAERPLVQKDQTASVRVSTSDDIKVMPLRGYAALTATQSGVVESGGNLHIRGGRFEEVAYYVDGFSQQNLLTGLSTTSINNNAIDQVVVMTGGFDPEYGRNMSGVVNVITREGMKDYHGSFEAITDEFTNKDWLKTNSYGYNNYDAMLSGPLLPGSDKVTFFASGERRDREDRTPRALVITEPIERQWVNDGTLPKSYGEDLDMLDDGKLPHNSLDGWSWQGKVKVNLSPSAHVKIGMLGSNDEYGTYNHDYRFDAAHMTKSEAVNNSVYGTLTYTLSPKTYFTYGANYFTNESKGGDATHFDMVKDYGRRVMPGWEETALYWKWDQDSTATTYDSQGIVTGDEGRPYRRYTQRASSYIEPIDFDLTSQATPHHEIRLGMDLQRHTLRLYDHLFIENVYKSIEDPTSKGGTQDSNTYGYKLDLDKNSPTFGKVIEDDATGRNEPRHPLLASLYFRDKMEYEGLVVNAGIRYDYLNSNADILKNERIPLGGDSKLDDADLAGNKAYNKLSPRLGIGFPVSDRTVFHTSYGKFFQQPNLENLYVGLDYLEYKAPLSGYYYAFGNPNLKPEETTEYEVGLSHQIGERSSLDITAYYKDVTNLVEATTIISRPAAFTSYRNKDFGTIKGADVSFSLRRINRVQASVNYSLSYATGTGSSSDTQRNIAWQFQPEITEPPKQTFPLDFDQRHKMSVNIDYRFADKDGPELGGSRPLSNAGANLLFSYGSGLPYTPTEVFNEVTLGNVSSVPTGPVNSVYGPSSYELDLKVTKDLKVGATSLTIYAWGINILDRNNIWSRDTDGRGYEVAVYSATGSAETTRWLSSANGQKFVESYGDRGEQLYRLKERDPRNSGSPRQIRFGLAYSF